jgi:hypothetical protein
MLKFNTVKIIFTSIHDYILFLSSVNTFYNLKLSINLHQHHISLRIRLVWYIREETFLLSLLIFRIFCNKHMNLIKY